MPTVYIKLSDDNAEWLAERGTSFINTLIANYRMYGRDGEIETTLRRVLADYSIVLASAPKDSLIPPPSIPFDIEEKPRATWMD